jgi:hypothetical protein
VDTDAQFKKQAQRWVHASMATSTAEENSSSQK